MKKLFCYTLLLLSHFSFGQRIIFTNPFGGQTSNGGISSYDFATGKVTTPISLSGNPLGLVDGWRIDADALSSYYNSFSDDDKVKENGMYAASDGYIYGLDQFAGKFTDNFPGNAILYRFHPDSLKIEILHNFTGILQENTDALIGAYKNALSKPRFGMIEGSPGVLYGICIQGGKFSKGGIWKYEIAKRKFTEVSSFDPTLIGYSPSGPLFKAFNDKLYGIVYQDIAGRDDGILYQIETTKDTLIRFNTLKPTSSGWAIIGPTGPVAYNSNTQKLYGCKRFEAGNAQRGGGMYSFDFNTKEVFHLNGIFQDRDLLGGIMTGLARGNNGAYYSVTESYGVGKSGTLLMMKNPTFNSGDLINMVNFTQTPVGSSIIAAGDKIFGTYKSSDAGFSMWCYNISSATLTNLLPYASGSLYGVIPQLAVSGNKIFARALYGGNNNAGGILSINVGSLEISELIQAHTPSGKSAVGELLDIGNNEYIGFSHSGGNLPNGYRNLSGTIMRYNIAKKTALSVASLETMTRPEIDKIITDFPKLGKAYENYALTYKPYSMFRGSNGKVYFYYESFTIPWYPEDYMYKQHQARQVLCEFDITTNTIKELTKINYGVPCQPLEYTPGKFLLARFDSLLVYDLNTGTLKGAVKPMDADKYGSFYGKWIKTSDGLIYGITSVESNSSPGEKCVLYSLDPAANFKFTVLQDLSADVKQANMGMTLANGKLYGSTSSGGTNGHGYLFSYDIGLKVFTKLYSFHADRDGANFSAGWTLNNNKLYSTSQAGGTNGYGTLVEFDLSNNNFRILDHLTIQNGQSVLATPVFPAYPTVADSTDISIKDTTVCGPLSLSLKATSTTVANPVFKWYSDVNLSALLHTGDTYTTPSLSATTNYYISVNGTGVLENIAGNGKKITVTVLATPATPIISADKPGICAGDTATLSSSNTSGNQWYKDGGILPAATLATLKVTTAGTYSVKTTSLAGCASATGTGVTIDVNIIPAAPTVSVDKLSFCAGDVATLTSSSVSGTQWYKDGNLINGATLRTYQATSSGYYAAKVFSSAVCASALSTVYVITANPVPATPVVSADGDLKICKDDIRNLSVVVPPNSTAQWYKNGTLISGSTGASISITETGTYTNRMITNAGCISALSNPSLVEVVCTTGIMMPAVFTPNGDGINDKVFAIIPGLRYLRTFEIYNRLGNMVFSTADKGNGWDGTFRGKQQPAESYIWVIEGVDSRGNKVKKTGMISLIR